MSDLIKREDAIEAILEDLDYIDDLDPDRGIMRACIRRSASKVKSLPPAEIPLFSKDFFKGYNLGAQKQGKTDMADRPQEWIPCSERLPKDWEHVLVCTTVTYTTPIFVDWYVDEVGSWANEGDSVIAWMPLPEPWKGADDE